MTDHRKFKDVIRQRMAKTGESYTVARMNLLGELPPAEAEKSADRAPQGEGFVQAPEEEVAVVPEKCPGCGLRSADPNSGGYLCADCAFDQAGFDHSPDYWD